tara:strand:+ start:180 stop:716 length:537 start_codon:yes stop_codon:yes gene_type:complete
MANKGAVALVVLGLLGLGFLMKPRGVTAAPEPSPGGGEAGAGITIGPIIDVATGLPVPMNSPAELYEGGQFRVPFTVVNNSTRLGALVGADLGIVMAGIAGNIGIGFPAPWIASFGPGESVSWDILFTVPDNTGPGVGEIRIRLNAPDGVQIAPMAIEPLTIIDTAITYAGTVTIGVF